MTTITLQDKINGLMDLYGYSAEDAESLLENDQLFEYQQAELATYLT